MKLQGFRAALVAMIYPWDGWAPMAVRARRRFISGGRLIRSSVTVALPVGVRPTRRSPSALQVKCSRQTCRRG